MLVHPSRSGTFLPGFEGLSGLALPISLRPGAHSPDSPADPQAEVFAEIVASAAGLKQYAADGLVVERVVMGGLLAPVTAKEDIALTHVGSGSVQPIDDYTHLSTGYGALWRTGEHLLFAGEVDGLAMAGRAAILGTHTRRNAALNVLRYSLITSEHVRPDDPDTPLLVQPVYGAPEADVAKACADSATIVALYGKILTRTATGPLMAIQGYCPDEASGTLPDLVPMQRAMQWAASCLLGEALLERMLGERVIPGSDPLLGTPFSMRSGV